MGGFIAIALAAVLIVVCIVVAIVIAYYKRKKGQRKKARNGNAGNKRNPAIQLVRPSLLLKPGTQTKAVVTNNYEIPPPPQPIDKRPVSETRNSTLTYAIPAPEQGQPSTSIPNVQHPSKLYVIKEEPWVAVTEPIMERFPYNAENYEKEPRSLNVIEEIGLGSFGIVFRGEYVPFDMVDTLSERIRPIQVAVKRVRNPKDNRQRVMLMCEICLLCHIGAHENIAILIGAITVPDKPLCAIFEYCNAGNLEKYLHRNGKMYQPRDNEIGDRAKVLTRCQFVNWAQQIANGMEFVHRKECVHRDLAARNILLHDMGGNQIRAKITDFGLSKDVMASGKYQPRSSTIKIPWRWYAPECLCPPFIYLSASDVWSFGVLLWEIFSLGRQPYFGAKFDAFFMQQLKSGYCLAKPHCADTAVYSLMLSCWQLDPTQRPSFETVNSDLKKWLTSHQRTVTVDNKNYRLF